MPHLHDAQGVMGAGTTPAPSVCALCDALYVTAPDRAKYAGRLARACDACRKAATDRWNAQAKPKKLAKSKRGKVIESECARCSEPFTYVHATRRRTICDECNRYRAEWDKFGLNRFQVAEIRAARCCAICGDTENPGGRSAPGVFHIDHDHTTGRIRGVLCHMCNTAIGSMRDDPARLRAAADYLERGTA